MGIGGLDKEFSDIFRRAFASRVFPPDIVEQMGEFPLFSPFCHHLFICLLFCISSHSNTDGFKRFVVKLWIHLRVKGEQLYNHFHQFTQVPGTLMTSSRIKHSSPLCTLSVALCAQAVGFRVGFSSAQRADLGSASGCYDNSRARALAMAAHTPSQPYMFEPSFVPAWTSG